MSGNTEHYLFNTIEEAIEAIRNGEMIIVTDDEDRENEGDLLMAAEKATPGAINFMVSHGRGLLCLPATQARLDELHILPMVNQSDAHLNTAYTVSIDAKDKTSTGISAQDRAQTVLQFVADDAQASDFMRPGHVFPLRAVDGGVLRRAGHTEAAVDLARLAGLKPAGVICEILNEDGTMARLPQLMDQAREHGLKIVNIADLIQYRRRTEKLVNRIAESNLPTHYGHFRMLAYQTNDSSELHVALVKGDVGNGEPVLVRVHSQCFTGDVLGSMRCDCGEQLHEALMKVEKEGHGVVLYMQQEGRGVGLAMKLRAYQLQDDEGLDTVEANERLGFPADLRDYGIGAQILVDLGVRRIRLMTNNPRKVAGLGGYGLEVVEQVPIIIAPHEYDRRYLETKRAKLGHMLFQGIEE